MTQEQNSYLSHLVENLSKCSIYIYIQHSLQNVPDDFKAFRIQEHWTIIALQKVRETVINLITHLNSNFLVFIWIFSSVHKY